MNGVDVYYERGGDGPPLLFFNGSGATLVSSARLIERFRQDFDVVAHDQRGLGRTSVPAGPSTMADFAADAAGLLDHVGWDRCAVVGISFGGMVAQEYAVTWPERVTRLGLLCTSSGGPGGASYPLHELADTTPQERAALWLTLLDTRFTGDWLQTHPDDLAMVAGLAERAQVDKSAEAVRGELAQIEARRDHDVWDRLPAIACPTLVAAGRFDGIAPVANSEAIASRVAGAEVRRYDGGHLFVLQDPTALPEIVGFLGAAP
jgi:pimeloyl-ACP methyl ester carboxylesterase